MLLITVLSGLESRIESVRIQCHSVRLSSHSNENCTHRPQFQTFHWKTLSLMIVIRRWSPCCFPAEKTDRVLINLLNILIQLKVIVVLGTVFSLLLETKLFTATIAKDKRRESLWWFLKRVSLMGRSTTISSNWIDGESASAGSVFVASRKQAIFYTRSSIVLNSRTWQSSRCVALRSLKEFLGLLDCWNCLAPLVIV